jgi:serine/threonine-protein kinase
VIGENQEDAVARLRDAGLSPIVREKSSSEPVDSVVSQSPAAGLTVDEGSAVTIFVSNGKVTDVPDVTGLSQDDAESELKSAGFDVAVRMREVTAEEDDGLVLSQSPRGGAERTKGTTVTITVGTFTPPPAPLPTP